jgi:signal transduction histidine kinase
MTSVAERARAALQVLSGVAVDDVAAALGVEPELVQRWAEQYAEGGELRLSGRMDPSSFEARDRFLALIAHEFRTPLTIIGGWVETMASTDVPAATMHTALDVIAKQVIHLERIARDALDAGAVARGQLRLEVGPVRLRLLFTQVVASMLDPAIGVEPGPEATVLADANRLEQVAGSLLGHASRLAGSASVRVAITDEQHGQVAVEVTIADRQIAFDDVAPLFEPYDREDTSIGTGLGLFLCRALVVAHGGEIGVRSDEAGTTFWFRLPTDGPEIGPLVERTPT